MPLRLLCACADGVGVLCERFAVGFEHAVAVDDWDASTSIDRTCAFNVYNTRPWRLQAISSGSSVSPTTTVTATPSASSPARPAPPATCYDGVQVRSMPSLIQSRRSLCITHLPPQDFGETDADCGGPCYPCSVGRGCLYASDCDQTGSTVAGTSYAPGTTMVVCSSSTDLCTDLRAGAQAYPNAAAQPATIGFNVSLGGLPPALFTPVALSVARTAVAGVLDSALSSQIQVGLRGSTGTPTAIAPHPSDLAAFTCRPLTSSSCP